MEPLTSKRTIKDVSHIFLSGAPSEAASSAASFFGVYLSKSILRDQQVINLLIQHLRFDPKQVNVCHLSDSHTVLRENTGFSATVLPDDVWCEQGLYGNAGVPLSTIFPYYFLVFRESECAKVDSLFGMLNPMIIVLEPHSKDLTEAFKLMKGVASVNPGRQWFLYFVSDAHTRSEWIRQKQILQEFNKVTHRFLETSIALIPEDPANQNPEWDHALKSIPPDETAKQLRLARWVDRHRAA